MDRRRRVVVRQAQSLVDQKVIDSFVIEEGGRHPRILVRKGGQERFIPFSTSPRSDRGASWLRQDIRRLVRQMNGCDPMDGG